MLLFVDCVFYYYVLLSLRLLFYLSLSLSLICHFILIAINNIEKKKKTSLTSEKKKINKK